MEERKLIVQFTSNQELPFVDIKKQAQNYSKKTNKIKKINLNEQSQSDKIKDQYLKLCKQIRFLYGVRTGKNVNHVHPLNLDKRVATQNNISGPQKLIIRQQKNAKFKGYNAVQQSELNNNFSNHFISIFESPQSDINISGNQVPSSINHPVLKVGRRKKILNNYLVKRLETQYLNIEKIKLENKTKQEKRLDRTGHRSDSTTSLAKRPSHTQQSQSNQGGNSKLVYSKFSKQQAESLPIITSITRGSQKQYKQIKTEPQQTNLFKPTTNFVAVQIKNRRAIKSRSIRQTISSQKPTNLSYKTKPFNPLFQTYFYRDLLWKTNFTNGMIIQTPLEYEHRLRVFIGKGNNSGLLRGLIKRRIWFAFTEKIQDANFVWTQIKYLPYFNLQKTQQIDKQLLEKGSQIQQNSYPDKIRSTGLLTQKQLQIYNNYFNNNMKLQERSDERFQQRNKYFISYYKRSDQISSSQTQKNQQNQKQTQSISRIKNVLKTVNQIKQQKMQNHLINNYVIGNKKALFKTMTLYYKKKDDYVFNYLPFTFHIQKGLEDQNYFKFLRYYYQRNKQSKANGGEQQCTWIVKPGQFSNRGNGIKVCKSLDQIKTILKNKQKYADGSQRTYIVQAYIQKPLLYNKRKFDLRHYMMMTCVNGILKGYWYREGYVRTSSSQYTLATNDGRIHLTNDAVQKNMPDYGKYEKGNKISYDDLHAYLLKCYGFKNYNFKEIIIPKMKKIMTDIVTACSGSIDPQLHSNNFQIFGLDFMIDADFNVWLIQVNTNPCLELSCPLLGSIIPKMVENALELTLDAVYPPPVRYNPKGIHYLKKLEQQNKFDLIYNSRINGFHKESQDALDARLLNQQEQTYQDQGEQWNEDD